MSTSTFTETRTLRVGASSTIDIPRVGFGLWQVPDSEVDAAVEVALDAGYRHLDTAQAYGNEAGVGRAIRAAADRGIERDQIFVTTKVWNDWHLQVPKALDESLERLRLDAVDLYLIHWPVPAADAYVQAWRSLLDLRQAGRARAVGVCNFHISHLQRLADETGELPAINQIELHPYFQQSELRAFCADNDIVVESWSPLASGKQVLDDPVIGGIADDHGVTPAQVIIRWHLQLGLVVLPKSVTPSRIQQNLEVDGFELSDEQMSAMQGLDRGMRTGPDPDEFNLQPSR